MLQEQAKIFYNNASNNFSLSSTTGRLTALSAQSDLNRFVIGSNRRLGILACGVTFPLVMAIKDQLDLEYPVLKIGQYPLPHKLMHKLFSECREVLILEEGAPIYEEWIRGYFDHEQVRGRLDGVLPRNGQLTAESIVKSFLL